MMLMRSLRLSLLNIYLTNRDEKGGQCDVSSYSVRFSPDGFIKVLSDHGMAFGIRMKVAIA